MLPLWWNQTVAGQDQIPFGRKSQHQAPLSMQNNWKFTQRNVLALGCKMFLITFPSLKKISAMQYHSQGWKLLLHYSLCCQECQKGQSYFKRRVSNGRAKYIVYLEKDCFPLQYQSWSTLDNIPWWILE